MTDDPFKARAARLLRGEFLDEDIGKLLLYLRDKPNVPQSIVEVGDFNAHWTDRERGIVTDEARRFFDGVRWIMYASDRKGNIDLWNAPGFLPTFLLVNAPLRKGPIAQKTGLKGKAADAAVKALAAKFTPLPGGRVRMINAPTEAEVKLFDAITRHVHIKGAFDEAVLFQDFRRAMIANGLFSPKTEKMHPAIPRRLSLSVMATMHLCRVKLENGEVARLYLDKDSNGKIGVSASTPTTSWSTHPDAARIFVAFSVFRSSMSAEDCCDPELLTDARDCPPVRVTPENRLVPI